MTMRRMLFIAGGAVTPIALIALLFNNQWVADAVRENVDLSAGFGPVVGAFQFARWRLTTPGSTNWEFLLAVNFQLLLFLALLVLLVAVGARALDASRGAIAALVTGWWATTIAGVLSGLIGGALLAWTMDIPNTSNMISRTVWSSVANGGLFGALFGWLAGFGALAVFLLTRERAQAAQQPYAAQQAYAGQQPYAPQYPGGQLPQQPHPQAAPYGPAQGQPQQPQWGGPPVPQQPGAPAPQQPGAPQQYGAPQAPGTPPVAAPAAPPQPPVPPQQEPAPQEQPAPPSPAGGPADQEPKQEQQEQPDEQEKPDVPGAEAAGDAPRDDDLNPDDRTVMDRRRDDD